MRNGDNGHLRIRKVKGANAKLTGTAETKAEGRKDGTAFLDVDVQVLPAPLETQSVAPLPPMGGHPLPRMGVRVAQGGDETDIVAPMGLTPVQMLNEKELQRGVGRIGNGKWNRRHWRNDGKKRETEAQPQMAQQPSNDAAMKRITEQAKLFTLESGRTGGRLGGRKTTRRVGGAGIKKELALTNGGNAPSGTIIAENEAEALFVSNGGKRHESACQREIAAWEERWRPAGPA